MGRQALGNLLSLMWQPWERGIAGRIGQATRNTDADAPISGEGWEIIRGWMEHGGEALREGATAARGGQSPGQQAMAQAMGVPAGGATNLGTGLKGRINRATERGYGVVGMFDVMARRLAEEGEARAMGFREAQRSGGTATGNRDRAQANFWREQVAQRTAHPDWSPDRVDREALQALGDADRAIVGTARGAADYRTLTQDLDAFGQWVEDGRNLPGGVGKYVVPFWKVPYNGMKYDLERSPAGAIGLARGYGQRAAGKISTTELYERWARALTGTLATVVLWKVAMDGNATGPEPIDPREKEQWRAEGKTPYSVRLGGRWVPAAMFPGVNASLVQAGYLADFARRKQIEGGPWDADAWLRMVNRAVTGTVSSLATRPFFDQFNQILTNLGEGDEEKGLGGAALDVAGGFLVPGAVRDVERAFGDTNRAPRDPLERVLANVPGLSQRVPERRDVYGRPSTRTGSGLERALNPLLGSQAEGRDAPRRYPGSTSGEMDTAIAEARRVTDAFAAAPATARRPTPEERRLSALANPRALETTLRSRERARLKAERSAGGPLAALLGSRGGGGSGPAALVLGR